MNVVRPNIHTTDHFIRTKDISQQERILLTKGNQHLTNAEPEAEKGRTVAVNDPISISPEAKELQEETPKAVGLSHSKGLECCRLTVLRDIFERFIGRSVPIISSDDVAAADPESAAGETPVENTDVPVLSESLSLALEYRKTETVSFSTTGSFQTKDGQEVSFSLELNFTRQVLAEQTLSAKFAEAIKDPFNIQYNGFASQISQTSFSFTIDCCRPGEEIVLEDTPVEDAGDVAPEEATAAAAVEESEAADLEESTEVAAAEEAEASAVENEEESAAAQISDFFDRLRVWAKDDFGHHRPVMFGVKGVGVMFHEKQGMEFTLKKLSHFLNKMAKIADRFNQAQQIAENEESPAVSNQA